MEPFRPKGSSIASCSTFILKSAVFICNYICITCIVLVYGYGLFVIYSPLK